MTEGWRQSVTERSKPVQTEPGSLRGRLIRRLALLLALILLVSSLSAYWSARHAADTAYDRTLLASARAIAARAAPVSSACRRLAGPPSSKAPATSASINRRARPGLSSALDVILPEQIIQRRAADAQQLGRARDIALGPRQRMADRLSVRQFAHRLQVQDFRCFLYLSGIQCGSVSKWNMVKQFLPLNGWICLG